MVTEPMPSMPIYFWATRTAALPRGYFETYPGVWRHGDWIEITERGTAIIYGRSDSTINRGGIRMGTGEIYRAVLGVDAVVDALVVDVPAEGADALDAAVRRPARGRSLERRGLRGDRPAGARAVLTAPRPDEVFEVDEVPRTLSGKVLEVPVKRILMGTPVEKAAAATRWRTRRRSTRSWNSPKRGLDGRVGSSPGGSPRGGVTRAYGFPGGGSNLDLVTAFAVAGIEFVLTHTEVSAALMACASAELTGVPWVRSRWAMARAWRASSTAPPTPTWTACRCS